ncbi:aspartate aminotransferase family protein [Rhizobium sp. S95]|uniref:Aspartate aminotransferase family protein n=1 Tax=Ciceribacter sichuanensis TaxID=2949647 RepID=A0AAJ1BY67_9HYPH|nr:MULTISPECIES: aspartate aminotransferase family protein [unclassified Ciceribacter]MCM2398475.1 aspartate aminotransferase family protein [Ciceribacter sp. S95]MCO5958480.1 aspartate aminotransferase family protein [Ciceribacter sp. S101]
MSSPKTTSTGSSYGVQALPKIAYGRGSYLYDANGKRYLDGSGGPAVYCLGHAHPEVTEAVKAQLDRVAHGYRYLFTSDAVEELTEIIRRNTGSHFGNIVFVTSGSEAVESCLKIALQYHTARGEKSRRRFISRRRSWHGNTLGALSVSDFKTRREAFEGSLLDVSFVSSANTYRLPEGVNAAGLVTYLANELEEEILKIGADKVAAFIFEPVVGAAGGVVPAPAGYAKAVAAVCRRHGVLLISDEVMCGSGRTGTWRALAEDGVVPDIMSIAKGLAAGYQPLGAALYSDHVHETLMAAHGGAMTGHTFTGHTSACAAGVAVQKIVTRDNLLDRVLARGPILQQELRAALADVGEVGDVRGRGFFIGLEMVADPVSKEPFPAYASLHAAIGRRAFEAGLICYPCTGNVGGVAGDTVILAPPYNASEEELREIVSILSGAIRDSVAEARRAVALR